jgi:outer membrane immunogenic protein
MKLRKVLFGLTLTSALALAASSTNAADVYVPGPGLKDAPVWTPEWAGFYIGVNGGYQWSDISVGSANGFGSSYFGLTGGYNLQRGPWVFGIEADIQGTLNASTGGSNAASLNDWGTVTGRAGYAIDRALFFVKGGFAWGDFDIGTQPFAGQSPAAGFNLTGYEIGGGIEYKVAPAWSLKVEYQHVDLGDITYAPAHIKNEDIAFNAIMVGANWHIGGWDSAPLK